MTKLRKSIASFLFVVALVFSAFAIISFNANTMASADTTNNYYTAEQYTDSDYLLLDNGTESLTKTIKNFSNEVKSAAVGTSFPELSQVIPLEYLESSQTEDTFQYNGKEYGFYVAKEGNSFDVLLIDFVYEFEDGKEHSDLEYKIRIKPILQQTFLRGEDANGDYIWTKSTGNYKYYVANPRFLSVVQNENFLNYGDSGYDKMGDDGVIIQQFRVNYGKVSYATEEDLDEVLNEFKVNTILNFGYDILDAITPGAGSVIGYIMDVVELGTDIYEAGKETTVFADNENNIETNFSKEEQRNNSRFDAYSRGAGFDTKDEIILSDANDSYMEMIVVLNDANYRTRLTQCCEFDIVRRSGNFSSMEYVAGNGYDEDEPSLNFSKQRVLFEDQDPQYIFEEEVYKSLGVVPVYLLPNGSQTVHFEPLYSANYKFSLPAGTALTVEDATASAGNEYYLEGGVSYEIILTNNSDTQKVISRLGCDLMDELVFGSNTVTIAGKTEHVFGLTADVSGYYRLTVNNDDISVDCDAAEMLGGTYYIHLEEDETVYPVLSNDSGQDINCRVTISDPLEIDLGDELNLTSYSGIYKFTNPYDETIDFQMILTPINGDSSATVYSADGSALGDFISGEDSRTNYFTLSEDESCYIIFEVEGEASVKIQPEESQLRWEIDGEYVSNDIALPRGESYSVRLVLLKNGEEVFHYTDIIGFETDSIKFDSSSSELNLLYDD